MFKVLIHKDAKKKILDYYFARLGSSIYDHDKFLSMRQLYTANSILESLFKDLKNDPFMYPQVTEKCRIAVTVYCPFLLLYTIVNDKVTILDIYLREEMFPGNE